jgi:hypothetical protein
LAANLDAASRHRLDRRQRLPDCSIAWSRCGVPRPTLAAIVGSYGTGTVTGLALDPVPRTSSLIFASGAGAASMTVERDQHVASIVGQGHDFSVSVGSIAKPVFKCRLQLSGEAIG